MTPESATFHIIANAPVWVVALGLAAAAGFAVWSYRRTLPPTALGLRIALGGLRWLALTGGILVLTQPSVELNRLLVKPGKTAVLVDRSASMALTQGGVDRIAAVRELLEGDGFKDFQSRQRVVLGLFADSLLAIVNKPSEAVADPPTGVGTDLVRAWMECREELALNPPQALMIISDGANNSGSDPARLARRSEIPIWTVGVGSPQPFRDAMILQIVANRTVYEGSVTPVEVKYRLQGAAGMNLSVVLYDAENREIARKPVSAGAVFSEGSLEFEVSAAKSGRIRYRAEITPLEGELTRDNNSRNFYLDVLTRKMRILVMAGLPDNSLGDLIRRLQRDEHVEIVQRTSKGKDFYEGGWPAAAMLKDIDLVLLHHFPSSGVEPNQLKAFADALNAENLSVAYFDGSGVDWRKLQILANLLPVVPSLTRERNVEGRVVIQQRHAVISPPDETETSDRWAEQPPLRFAAGRFEPRLEAQILAVFQSEAVDGKFPAIVISETGGRKRLAWLGQDQWRWGLYAPGEEGVWDPFLERLIRWLSARKQGKRVDVQFDRDLFSNHEPVCYTVFVQDEGFVPFDGALVSAKVLRKGKVSGESVVGGIGQGQYRGSFQPWEEGEYDLKVTAQFDGQTLGEDQARIMIEPFNIELLDAGFNEILLKSVAEFSGGGYVRAEQADSLFRSLTIPAQEKWDSSKWEVRGRAWLLVFIIGCLSVEWFIRIRSGML